ncbi:hypothetical protein BDZ90DRAFT_234415 [Jaminaea rosea]|uniref:Uncharacterized protein n=1 Tax=Jaminaea rosea TaxID=1569628 RepID=A0A316UIV9_9BASI|nr:hypothetical protein BDZ90DRAFT_234415 [Jaminaea rosea]PWN25212.1 hypothetical protein BDZ90DRAFT_234415 [Jaminaea rosea]
MEHPELLPATTPTRALLRRLRRRSSLAPSTSCNFPLAPPPPVATSDRMAPATRSATRTGKGAKVRAGTATGAETPCPQQRRGGPRLTWEAARKLESEFEAQEKILQGLQRDNESKTIEVEHLRREARVMTSFLSTQYGDHWEKIVFGGQRRASTMLAAAPTAIATPKMGATTTKLPSFLLHENDDDNSLSQSMATSTETASTRSSPRRKQRSARSMPNSPVKPDDTRGTTLFWEANDASFEAGSSIATRPDSPAASSITPRQVAAADTTSLLPTEETTGGETDDSFLLSRFLSSHRQDSVHEKQEQEQRRADDQLGASSRSDDEVQDITALLLSSSVSSIAPLSGAGPMASTPAHQPKPATPPRSAFSFSTGGVGGVDSTELLAQVQATRALVEALAEDNDARLVELRKMEARTKKHGEGKVAEMRALIAA